MSQVVHLIGNEGVMDSTAPTHGDGGISPGNGPPSGGINRSQ